MIIPIKSILLESFREDVFTRRVNNLPRKQINDKLAIGTGIVGGGAVGGTLANLGNDDQTELDKDESSLGDSLATGAGIYGGAIIGAGLGANDWVKNKFQENKIASNIQSRINSHLNSGGDPRLKGNPEPIRPEHVKDLGINVYNNIKTGINNTGNNLKVTGSNILNKIKSKVRY